MRCHVTLNEICGLCTPLLVHMSGGLAWNLVEQGGRCNYGAGRKGLS